MNDISGAERHVRAGERRCQKTTQRSASAVAKRGVFSPARTRDGAGSLPLARPAPASGKGVVHNNYERSMREFKWHVQSEPEGNPHYLRITDVPQESAWFDWPPTLLALDR